MPTRQDLKNTRQAPGEEADFAWVRRSFPAELRQIRVHAYRAWQGLPRDPKLERIFPADPSGLRAAVAYAKGLVDEKTAVSCSIELDVKLTEYTRKYEPGWTWACTLGEVEDGAGVVMNNP